MVLQLLPWGRADPALHHGRIKTQHVRQVQCRQETGCNRGLVGDQPDPVQAVLFATQNFAQLPLEIQVLLAALITSPRSHRHQQPLAFEAGQCDRFILQVFGADLRHVFLRLDQLTINTTAFRPDHVVGEVRGNDRRRADQQHGDHFPAAHAGALGIGLHHRRRAGHVVHRHGQGAVRQVVFGGGVGQFGTRHKVIRSDRSGQTIEKRNRGVFRHHWPPRAIRAASPQRPHQTATK